MANWQDIKLGLEMASGGKNTILFDNVIAQTGKPSVMVKIPKMKYSNLYPATQLTTWGVIDDYFPAFKLADGTVKDYFMCSKYENVIEDSKAYSLPNRTPASGMDFDTAQAYCTNKGTGWHLMTNAEWGMIQLLSCMFSGYNCTYTNILAKNYEGVIPKGNNYYGSQKENIVYTSFRTGPNEIGIEATNDGSGPPAITNLIKTGSGPNNWNHDNTPWGISDLNGNVSEWIAGLRYKDHELQITRYNESAIIGVAGHLAGSTDWYTIKGTDGTYTSLADPNAVKAFCAGTGYGMYNILIHYQSYPGLYYDGSGDFAFINLGTGLALNYRAVFALTSLGLAGGYVYGGGGLGYIEADSAARLIGNALVERHKERAYLNSTSITEKIAIRGGDYESELAAGIMNLDLRNARTFTSAKTGFRCCWLP